MSRFKEVKEIYEKITYIVTGSKKEWKDFLTFAARIYKYNFDNAILIYAQRPDATMVANMEIWNRKIGRYINRGTRSIAVFDTSKPSLKLEYLFDVKDTNGETHTVPKLWSLNDNTTPLLIDKLNKKYDFSYNDLDGLIGELVEMKVNANLENSFADFENDTQNTWLQDLPIEGLISCFAQTIIESSHYMVVKRCGIDSLIYNDDNSFRLITHFNTLPLTLRLGNAVCSISQEILREIESEVNLIIREKRSERNNERSISNELQGSRGNILSRDSNIQGQGSRREAIREVWTDGTELSEGKSSEQIQLTFGKGGTDADNAQGEQGSLWEIGANNGTDIEDKSNKNPENTMESFKYREQVKQTAEEIVLLEIVYQIR